MSVSAITPNSTSTATANAVINPKSNLNQTDFLKLLVAQIQFQDPMNPQSDTQMAAQMAQFSALQQSTEMSSSLAMLQANGLVGSTVTLQLDSKNSTEGVVQGVVMNNGSPQILVNDQLFSLKQITSVTPTINNPVPVTPTTP